MDRYGYYGNVSYQDQNRYRAYYQGLNGVSMYGMRGVGALRSGGYAGAPGRMVDAPSMNGRQQAEALMMKLEGVSMAGSSYGLRGAGMNGAGLGTISDRALCTMLSTLGVAVVQAAGTGVIGARPTTPTSVTKPDGSRAVEPPEHLAARQRAWDQAHNALASGSNVATALTNLCNLIEEPVAPGAPAPTGPTQAELDAARMDLMRLQAQQGSGMSDTTKIALGVGGVAVVGALAYFALR